MSNRFGLSDSLLEAVKSVAADGTKVDKHAAFGLTEMSSKEKMKRGLYNSKLDPVGKADADIDNDGDVDDSDEYLKNRRKTIKKAMGKKSNVEINPEMKESNNAPSKENGGIAHMCASHVQHATYGEGVCIPGEHTIVETAAGEGYVTHYDVIFDGQIVENVAVEDLEIIKEASHMHSNVKKDKKKMIAGQKMKEEVEEIDELKKSTLSSYIKKAAGEVSGASSVARDFERDADRRRSERGKKTDRALAQRFRTRSAKRKAGIGKAADKLAKEETKVDSGLENPHNCATHVFSESWGSGKTVTTMHADPDQFGNIAWYDVMFEHGIEKGVPIEELKVVKSESHMHSKRGKK